MDAVIQLTAELAAAMATAALAGATQGQGAARIWPEPLARMKADLDEQLARYGASLRPMHPGVEDSELQRFYTLSLADDAEAEAALLALRSLEAVTAAYVKPGAEPA